MLDRSLEGEQREVFFHWEVLGQIWQLVDSATMTRESAFEASREAPEVTKGEEAMSNFTGLWGVQIGRGKRAEIHICICV